MNINATILFLFFVGLFGSSGRAEVEYEIHTGISPGITCFWSEKPPEFPILISLADKHGNPIRGAIVVLKRLGPDGWTEEELKREKDSKTDKNGMVIVMYPSASATRDEAGRKGVVVYGAVTVIAEGHKTVTIELRDHFKDGRCILSTDSAPHLKLSLNQ